MTLTNFGDTQLVVAHGDAYSKLTMTDISAPNTAFDVFKRGKEGYANRNYDEAVDSFTNAIEVLQRDLSTALIHRAIAFEMKKKYERALEDIVRIQEVSPLVVPDTYLAMANTLLLQDKLREAALQLHTGLTVIPTSCTQYSSLIQLYQQVRTEMDRRNRRLANVLPCEILNRILLLLPAKYCIRLSFTCRYWNNYIMQEWSGNMWSTIDTYYYRKSDDLPIHDGTHADMALKVLKSIPPDSVRSIKLHQSLDYWMEEIVDAVIERRWNKIEYLNIGMPDKKSFCQLLKLNQSSIKKIDLWNVDQINENQSVESRYNTEEETIIDDAAKYTNLQSITMHYKKKKASAIVPQLSLSRLVLTRLELDFSLSYVPWLYVSRSKYYADTLYLINDRCPTLKELIFGKQDACDQLTLKYSSTPINPGLTMLYLSLNGFNKGTHLISEKDPELSMDDEYLENSTDMENRSRDDYRTELLTNSYKRHCTKFQQQSRLLVQRNRNSLQSLTVTFSSSFSMIDRDLLLDITSTGFPMLTRLNLTLYHRCPDFGPSDLQQIIAACSSLEQVQIYGGGIWDINVFEELAKLTSLRYLDIDLDDCIDITRITAGNRNGLTHLVTNSETLRSFSLGYRCHDGGPYHNCGNTQAHVNLLSEIARCVSDSAIQEFDISKVSILSENEFVLLSDCLKDSQLSKLFIKIDCSTAEDKFCQAIASLQNLSFLQIFNLKASIFGGGLDEHRLIQLFNEHKKASGTFVVQVIGNFGLGNFSGRKEYPMDNADYLNTDIAKDENYYMKLYAIKKVANENSQRSFPFRLNSSRSIEGSYKEVPYGRMVLPT